MRLLNPSAENGSALPSLTSPPTLATPDENPGILKGILVVCRVTGWREVGAGWLLGRGLENVGCRLDSRPRGADTGESRVGVNRGGVVGLPGWLGVKGDWRVEKLGWLVGRAGCLVVIVDG